MLEDSGRATYLNCDIRQAARFQRDIDYIDGRSHMYIHTDERTQVPSAWSSLVVTHSGTNQGQRALTSANVLPSWPWFPRL